MARAFLCRRWRPGAAALACFFALLWSGRGYAQPETPVIEAGREKDVLALFSPYKLGSEVSDGWHLENVKIEGTYIRCEIQSPNGKFAVLDLRHRREAKSGQVKSKNFVLIPNPKGVESVDHPSLQKLMAAIVKNDKKRFWRKKLRPKLVKLKKGEREQYRASLPPSHLLRDGAVQITAACLVLGFLLQRQLRGRPLWVPTSLCGIALLGVALRLWLSPQASLGVWPYSRVDPLAGRLFHGMLLSEYTYRHPAVQVYLESVIYQTHTLFAILGPLAAYTHMRPLFGKDAPALLTSLIICVLPAHLHFSRSDSLFISSLFLSCLSFGTVHAAASDPSRIARGIAFVCLPGLVWLTLEPRPLNMLFLLLYLAQIFWVDDGGHRKRFRWIIAGVLAAVAIAFFFAELLPEKGRMVREGLSFSTLFGGLWSMVSPRLNTLLHPRVTPVPFVIAAIGGTVVALRKGRDRKLIFLLAWTLLFFVTHGVITPKTLEMQSRYHLHLAVPVAALVAAGFIELAPRLGRWKYAALVVLVLSPLQCLDYIRDISKNDTQEYLFVQQMARKLPSGCHVYEYLGDPPALHESRFRRMGAMMAKGVESWKFKVHTFPKKAKEGELPAKLKASLEADDGPSCRAFYEGLYCLRDAQTGENSAPLCLQANRTGRWKVLGERRFQNRPYDPNLEIVQDGERPLTIQVLVRQNEEDPAPHHR